MAQWPQNFYDVQSPVCRMCNEKRIEKKSICKNRTRWTDDCFKCCVLIAIDYSYFSSQPHRLCLMYCVLASMEANDSIDYSEVLIYLYFFFVFLLFFANSMQMFELKIKENSHLIEWKVRNSNSNILYCVPHWSE